MTTKRTTTYGALIILAITALSALPAPVHATVGGPTYVHSLKYNPADQSVYYVSVSESGRGCPPELKKISLNTGKTDTVFSCSQGEALLTAGGQYNYDLVTQRIEALTQNFKDLTEIHLRKNNFAVDVNFVRSEKMTPQEDWVFRSFFTAKTYQNGVQLAEFPIIGCNLDQPFTFAGYAIPGFEKKIILLVSAKGDCFEGGYITESLHVVAGVNGLDKTYAGGIYKGRSILVPSETTLSVYERDTVIVPASPTSAPVGTTTIPAEPKNDVPFSLMHLFIAAIISLLVGVIAGKLIFDR